MGYYSYRLVLLSGYFLLFDTIFQLSSYTLLSYLFLVGTGGGLAGNPASSLIDNGLLADCAPADTAEATAEAAAPEAVLKAAIFSFL